MKIINLTKDSRVYTSNAYFLLGDWKAFADVNVLIDVGRDFSVIERIKQLDTGVGKKKVEKVFLTHGHFDHTGLLSAIKDEFHPEVYAYHPFNGSIRALRDGQTMKLADRWFEVIYTPGHTSDSVCFYCPEEGVIFSGDTSLMITSTDNSYQESFVKAFERIARRDIKAIYPGHGKPIVHETKKIIFRSLDYIRKSRIF